jgi:hypothetical protein
MRRRGGRVRSSLGIDYLSLFSVVSVLSVFYGN